MKSTTTEPAIGRKDGDETKGASLAPFTSSRRIKLEKMCRSCRKRRRGAAVVEFAVVAPVFFLLVFGMIEYGRMVMVQQIMTNASREGARLAVLDGVLTGDVVSSVDSYMAGAGISGASVSVTTNAPVAPDFAESMTVTVDIPFNQVSWLPSPMFLNGYQMTATSTMRRETVN
ncbi:MAG: TadE/TadG family type IV pilus assembly protein [Pirellulales bacterium]